MSEAYDKLRAALDERLKADKRLETIAQKITSGKADFKDTAKYSQIVSHIMGEVMQENIGSITVPLGKELVCKELLREHYERINDVLGEVQASVDDKLGIHLNPVRAPFPTERVDKAAHSLEDPTVPEETIKRRARSTTENIANSMHDDYIQTNASRRDAAGLKSFLVREVGAGGCCKWCASLAGRYDYATAPDDIFRRHDNCNCSVTYENGRQRQDVWSKKTWQASEDELKARKEVETASKPVVNSKEQAKELEARVLDKTGKSGIIKSIDIDDYKLITGGKEISSEVNDMILSTMKKCEKDGNFVISEISDTIKSSDTEGTPILQIEPMANGLLKLNVNVRYLSGKSLEKIDQVIAETERNLAQSLEEAIIHESGHAILIKGKKVNQIKQLYQELKKQGKPGISNIAQKDGVECLAELEVLRHRKTPVSKEMSDFYEKYMGRKYL